MISCCCIIYVAVFSTVAEWPGTAASMPARRSCFTSSPNRQKPQVATELNRITQNPNVMGGKPCIRGMRVTVGQIGADRSITRRRRFVPPHPSMRPAGWKDSAPRPATSSYCRYFSLTTCWACASSASAAFGSVWVSVR